MSTRELKLNDRITESEDESLKEQDWKGILMVYYSGNGPC